MKRLGGMHFSLLALALINMLPAIEAEDSWGLFAIALASAVLSLAWFKWRGGKPVPRWLVLTGVVASTGYLIYEMFYPQQEQTVHIIDLSHFIILLGCCKFFDFQSHRDAGLIALISFLLMVISAFVTASPLFAIATVIDVTFGLAWLLHFHTQREAFWVEQRQRKLLAVAGGSLVETEPAQVDGSRAGIKRTVFLCSLFLLAASIGIFLVMPRGWRGGIFSRMHGLVPASVTGFSDSVELTDNPVTEDNTNVLRARFHFQGRDIVDEAYQPYLRGLTFDRYAEGRWQRTPTVIPRSMADASLDTPLPIIDLREQVGPEDLMRQEIWLDAIGTGTLFALYPPLMFGSNDIGRVNIDRKDLVIEASTSSRKAAHYTVWSSMEPIYKLLNRPLRTPQLPRDGESIIPRRIREFAQTFVPAGVNLDDLANHERVASAIRDHLASDRYEYVLSRGESRDRSDPIIDFLFETRRGHCEYFASAMTLMCQSLGMHARLVSGYQGGEYNEVGGFYQFRRKDAHAWVEIWLPERSWTPFDPTPPSATSGETGAPTLWQRFTRFVDFLQFKWSTTIVSFDERNRAQLVAGISDWVSDLVHEGRKPRSLGDFAQMVLWGPEFFVLWQRVLYWFLLLLVVTLLVVALRVFWILSLMVREYFPSGRLSRSILRPADARFYDRLIVLLEHKGHVKPAGATPKEFAERLARAHHDLGDVPLFIEWFYEAQYGGRSLGRQRWERIRDFLGKLREDPSFGVA